MTDLLDDEGLLNIGRRRSTDPEVAVQEIRGRRQPMPQENDALRDWRPAAAPEVPATCHLCGRPPRLQCKACGRGACRADSWVMLALCRTCATEERMKAQHERPNVGENWLE